MFKSRSVTFKEIKIDNQLFVYENEENCYQRPEIGKKPLTIQILKALHQVKNSPTKENKISKPEKVLNPEDKRIHNCYFCNNS